MPLKGAVSAADWGREGVGFLNLSGSRVDLMECCKLDKYLQINAINLN